MTNQCCLILSPNSFDENGEFVKPIGTGYFQYESFDANQSILTLVPYEGYWAGKPDSSITRRVIKSIPDASTRALAASNGEVDVAIDVPFSELRALENEPGIKVLKYNTARTYLWSYNLEKPYLQDVNVRRALFYAVNREELVNDVLLGVGGVAHGVMMDEIPWTNTDVNMYDYDPDMAKKLLDEAGFVDSDGDGIREYKGEEVKITLITGSNRPGLPLIAQAMQGYFAAIGVDAEAQVLEGNTMQEVRNSGQWALVSNSMAACYIPSASYFVSQMYYSGSSNASRLGYKNEELDKVVDACMATDDLEEKYALSRQAQAMAQEDAVTHTVCLYGAVFIMNDKLTGFDYSPAVHDFVVPITTDIAD
jgi:peptide/nickel transport system substrate-binding protein